MFMHMCWGGVSFVTEFVFNVEDVENDILVINLWDYDPPATLKSTLTGLKEVSG